MQQENSHIVMQPQDFVKSQSRVKKEEFTDISKATSAPRKTDIFKHKLKNQSTENK